MNQKVAVEILTFNMEEVCKRFPLVAEDVIKNIDYQSLTKFKEASRDVSEFLDNGRVLWKQMILKNITGI